MPVFSSVLAQVYCSSEMPSLMPMLAPLQWHFSRLQTVSTQYSSHCTPRPCHMVLRASMQALSLPQKPYSFSICSSTMGPPFLAQKGLRTGTRDWKQSLTSLRQTSLLDLSLMPLTLSRRAGKPPKSHSAQTQGPGRMSTQKLCFLASSRKRVRFLLPVSQSNLPLAVSWQFHMMQTLRALKPMAFIICSLCYQYSAGMREQCTSPAINLAGGAVSSQVRAAAPS